MSYTKGKWISEPSMASSKFTRDILFKGQSKIIAQVGGMGQDEDIANARLIAAAPNLLEALRRYYEITQNPKKFSDDSYEDAKRAAIEAIAKTEGR